MTTHYIPADEEIAAKGDEARVRCCGRRVRYLPDGDDMADPAWPGVEITCVGREHLERDGSVGTVHRAPVGDEQRVPCCGRLLTELPFNDRIALRGTPAEDTTNCPGPGVGGRSIIHRYPLSGDEHDAMPCCGRAVVEVPDTDGMAETDDLVTCPGPMPRHPGEAVIMAGPPPTTRTREEIKQTDRDEREALTKQEAAELAEARTRVEAGADALGRIVAEVAKSGKVNLTTIGLLELRARVNILSDAAFGDGTIDQYGFELAVQRRFRDDLAEHMRNATKFNEVVEAERRKQTLLDGVTMRVPPPGGRP